ncbi:MAG: DUF3459 domain-containing protein, partial [Firmicutes bacterium]|nr:DUF3459 domain-containing protein [Bacillota bacterium]
MAEFDRLLKEAHRRKLRIIMDIVPSVTSHLHPWFIESRASRRSPKRDWYIWRDAPCPGRYPNNWRGVFGGRAWDWDKKTQQYYYHNSLPEQPDLNWRNPEVEEAVLGAMEFWFARGVDGFRIDVLNYVFKDEQFRSNPLCLGRRPYEMQRHLYDKDRPEAVEVGFKMRKLADRYPGRVLAAEIFMDNPEEAVRYYGANGEGTHMVFNFTFMFARYSAAAFQRVVDHWQGLLGNKNWPCYFLSNHDNPRHISRYAAGRRTEARARVAAAMLLTLRGTPFIYMGEELGMRSLRIKRHELMDPVGVTYWPFHPGRDGARTPLQWNSEPHAGFSTVKPWLPVNPDYRTVNVAQAEEDPHSLLAWYKELISLRRRHRALLKGSYHSLKKVPCGVFAYLREEGEERILVLLNFTGRKKSFSASFESGAAGAQILAASPGRAAGSVDLNRLHLGPDEVLILLLEE